MVKLLFNEKLLQDSFWAGHNLLFRVAWHLLLDWTSVFFKSQQGLSSSLRSSHFRISPAQWAVLTFSSPCPCIFKCYPSPVPQQNHPSHAGNLCSQSSSPLWYMDLCSLLQKGVWNQGLRLRAGGAGTPQWWYWREVARNDYHHMSKLYDIS